MTDRPLRVLLVTSWNTNCGIADYGAALKESVEAADPGIEVIPEARFLEPDFLFGAIRPGDVCHINHHDALHARWTADHVAALEAGGIPVVVTFHDSRSGELGSENSSKAWALNAVASAFIVHEPVADLPGAIYWRHGVPKPAAYPADYTPRFGQYRWLDGEGCLYAEAWKAFPQQPVLGTVGFNFPWKNYDRLAQLTAEEGWALVILSNNATEADERRWRGINPDLLCVRRFLPQPEAINYLAGCDATAFMYECANNGTSGAIRQGIAARKPVIALETCRQFRDLYDDLGANAIDWVHDWEDARIRLRYIRSESAMHSLAHQDRWALRGAQHAQLYRRLVEARR